MVPYTTDVLPEETVVLDDKIALQLRSSR